MCDLSVDVIGFVFGRETTLVEDDIFCKGRSMIPGFFGADFPVSMTFGDSLRLRSDACMNK